MYWCVGTKSEVRVPFYNLIPKDECITLVLLENIVRVRLYREPMAVCDGCIVLELKVHVKNFRMHGIMLQIVKGLQAGARLEEIMDIPIDLNEIWTKHIMPLSFYVTQIKSKNCLIKGDFPVVGGDSNVFTVDVPGGYDLLKSGPANYVPRKDCMVLEPLKKKMSVRDSPLFVRSPCYIYEVKQWFPGIDILHIAEQVLELARTDMTEEEILNIPIEKVKSLLLY
jgi:hypothetical protein